MAPNSGAPKEASNNEDRVPRESKKLAWAMFITGNFVSVAVVVSEIREVNVCFDDNLSGEDDDSAEDVAFETFHLTMFLLVFGLLVDAASAVILSAIYRSPLDIRSVHKIPAQDMRGSFAACVIVKVVTPLVWGTVYFSGAVVCMNYGKSSLCGGGAGGAMLRGYLEASGAFMGLFGMFMLVLSVRMWSVVCGGSSPGDGCCVGCCCGAGCTVDDVHAKVLSRSPILDGFWQLQGVLLSYRIGALSPIMAFAAGSLVVVGEALVALGSFAPESLQEIVGPTA